MNLPLAPIAAALLGAGAAAAVVLTPAPLLETAVMESGLPAVIAAAAPPLGMTARLALAAGAGAVTAIFAWLALFVLFGTRGLTIGRAAPAAQTAEEFPAPVIRRADAHPDAPPRAPLLATRDLGTPFLEVITRSKPAPAPAAPLAPDPEPVAAEPVQPVAPEPAPPAQVQVPSDALELPPRRAAVPERQRIVLPDERPLPEDLDQPLSAFDPSAIPPAPAPLPEAVAPLARPPRPAVFDSSERFETFELTPVRRDPPRPRPVPEPRVHAAAKAETEATIHALLERLEQGVVRKGMAEGMEKEPPRRRDSERGLEDALVTLRNLARRA
ncbi:hypothetical protein ACFQ1E_08690 [Sphingomonas canadensis]|uniref:Uncharacterized protein n=1 Tax=Sphingomonas canadensis TaxID=1219257 RepID=A0ABW3H4H8_9SPHN|nr:hypothetical protein [Sphingomonas canadensis]MCW3836116.1 hypothetical protein [Sphingomonas canadensis]